MQSAVTCNVRHPTFALKHIEARLRFVVILAGSAVVNDSALRKEMRRTNPDLKMLRPDGQPGRNTNLLKSFGQRHRAGRHHYFF
ncbi:MAG TPA: hypothetical protein VJQ55_18325 [Candidatus Binatia bacterium]|nr:hypothetical protein [Candidatus Binatia bacterium]